MAYNIHHGAGTDGKLNLERIATLIRNAAVDVVGLNEVDNRFGRRSAFADQARILADRLGMEMRYGPTIVSGDAEKPRLYGNAILSHHPIRSWRNHPLPRWRRNEPRCCLEAVIDFHGREVTFLVTHLDHRSEPGRLRQARELLRIAEGCQRPVVLLGDFNSPPGSPPIRELKPLFVDSLALLSPPQRAQARKGKGNHPLDPRGKPRIDYIFLSLEHPWKVHSVSFLDDPIARIASDHRPYRVILRW